MTMIDFYEKPGCAGNARQRALLEAVGHTLRRHDLLSEPWTRESLLVFLAPLAVDAWFNSAAPRIKSGEIRPQAWDRDRALAALIAEPILIRRPLMRRADGVCLVGFDLSQVEAFVGLAGVAPARTTMESCAAVNADASCTTPEHLYD